MRCCVCQKEIITENPKKYFCKTCWKEWNEAILNKELWIKACVNDEHQQRRQALKDSQCIYLGDKFDVGDCGGEYKLVPTKDYYDNLD